MTDKPLPPLPKTPADQKVLERWQVEKYGDRRVLSMEELRELKRQQKARMGSPDAWRG